MAADLQLPPDLAILNGPYLADILFQPEALAATLAGLESLPPFPGSRRPASRVVLTAMGGSLHALHPLQIRLNQAGLTALQIETSELLYSQPALLQADTLLVIVSQSGRSAEILTLLDAVEGPNRPYVIGVTNTQDSPLARGADFIVPTKAGPEHSVSCKTFVCSLLALEYLAAALTGTDWTTVRPELAPAADAAAAYLARWQDHVRELQAELKEFRHLFLTGRGSSLAPVGTGGLILKESTHTHSEGMSSPAFRHGPFEMIHPGLYAIILAGDPTTAALNEKLARDVLAAGARAGVIGPRSSLRAFEIPAVPQRIRPILEMLPIQMVSLALAANKNRQPGVFERITKVTEEE